MSGNGENILAMSEAKRRIAKRLMCAGLIPFWVIALAEFLWSGHADGFLAKLLMGYGAVIVSFVAGIHWGLFLTKDAPWNLFVHSNVVALAAWISLLLEPLVSYSLLVLCLFYLLALDFRLYYFEVIDRWFFTMRILITSLVCLALLLAIVAHSV